MGLRRSLRRRSRPALLALRQPSRWPPPPAERLCCGLPASLGLHPRMAVAGAHAEASLLWLSRRDADSTGKKTRMRSHSAICSAYSRNCRSSHRQSLLGSNQPLSIGAVDQSFTAMREERRLPWSTKPMAASVVLPLTKSSTSFFCSSHRTYFSAGSSCGPAPGAEKPRPSSRPPTKGLGLGGTSPSEAGVNSAVRTVQHCSKSCDAILVRA
mmetsp:Transcript_15410/g.47477  ORF Transcript_15410/g.47477 Transcript_15410/m.47477 type:complete len:212 (-) Transcript_15410:2831-3466(-)